MSRRKMAKHHEACSGCGSARVKCLPYQNGDKFYCSKKCLYGDIGEPKVDDMYMELARHESNL